MIFLYRSVAWAIMLTTETSSSPPYIPKVEDIKPLPENGKISNQGKNMNGSINYQASKMNASLSSNQKINLNMNNQKIGIKPQCQPSKFPAIAIKPKPNIAPAPISNQKASFDINSRCSFKPDMSLNINTSKKWVLPPRPRPGRKPTSSSPVTAAKSPSLNPQSLQAKSPPKKKVGRKKEEFKSKKTQTPPLNASPTTCAMPISAPKKINLGKPAIPINPNHSNGSLLNQPRTRPDPKINSSQAQAPAPAQAQEPPRAQAPPQVPLQVPAQHQVQAQAPPQVKAQDPAQVSTPAPPPAAAPPQPIRVSAVTPLMGKVATKPISSISVKKEEPKEAVMPKGEPAIDEDKKNKTGNKKKTSDKNDIVNLQSTYLSKLKEQELIRNYIEVISNQIKELRFVQNGVITFDALNDGNKTMESPPTPSTPISNSQSMISSYEQLEKINNINDLNKFLAYLTKSSNIIHSVTKKYLNGDKIEPANETEGNKILEEQINYYLKIKSKYKYLKNQEVKSIEKLKKTKIKNEAKQPSPTMLSPINSLNNTPAPMNQSPGVLFTPNLLKPINSKIYNEEDVIGFDNDILENANQDNFFQDQNEIFQNLTNETTNKKKNCGFCTNDTPCFCFEFDDNELK